MNLLWRNNFGSFLDASAPDANGDSTLLASTLGSGDNGATDVGNGSLP